MWILCCGAFGDDKQQTFRPNVPRPAEMLTRQPAETNWPSCSWQVEIESAAYVRDNKAILLYVWRRALSPARGRLNRVHYSSYLTHTHTHTYNIAVGSVPRVFGFWLRSSVVEGEKLTYQTITAPGVTAAQRLGGAFVGEKRIHFSTFQQHQVFKPLRCLPFSRPVRQFESCEAIFQHKLPSFCP